MPLTVSPCSLRTDWVFCPAAGAGTRVGADALLKGGLARQGGWARGRPTQPPAGQLLRQEGACGTPSCRSRAAPGRRNLRLMHLASSTWVVPRPPSTCTAPVIPEAARVCLTHPAEDSVACLFQAQWVCRRRGCCWKELPCSGVGPGARRTGTVEAGSCPAGLPPTRLGKCLRDVRAPC